MSDERKFNVTLDAEVLVRVSNIEAATHKEAYEKAVESVYRGEFHALFQMTKPISGVDWTQFGETFSGGVVDVVGEAHFQNSQTVDGEGRELPIPAVTGAANTLLAKAIRAVQMQLSETDQSDWLYRKLSGILMELQDTEAVIYLRDHEKPNPNREPATTQSPR